MYLLLLQRCKYPALTIHTKVLAACHQQVSTRVTGILADHVRQPVITLQQHLAHATCMKQAGNRGKGNIGWAVKFRPASIVDMDGNRTRKAQLLWQQCRCL